MCRFSTYVLVCILSERFKKSYRIITNVSIYVVIRFLFHEIEFNDFFLIVCVVLVTWRLPQFHFITHLLYNLPATSCVTLNSSNYLKLPSILFAFESVPESSFSHFIGTIVPHTRSIQIIIPNICAHECDRWHNNRDELSIYGETDYSIYNIE